MSHIGIPVDNTINLLVYYQLLRYFLAHQQVPSFLKSQRFLSQRFLFDLFLEHSLSTLSNLSMPAIQACSSPPIELSNNQQIHPYSSLSPYPLQVLAIRVQTFLFIFQFQPISMGILSAQLSEILKNEPAT